MDYLTYRCKRFFYRPEPGERNERSEGVGSRAYELRSPARSLTTILFF